MKLDNKLKERLEEKLEVNYARPITLILEMENILTKKYKLYYSKQNTCYKRQGNGKHQLTGNQFT